MTVREGLRTDQSGDSNPSLLPCQLGTNAADIGRSIGFVLKPAKQAMRLLAPPQTKQHQSSRALRHRIGGIEVRRLDLERDCAAQGQPILERPTKLIGN